MRLNRRQFLLLTAGVAHGCAGVNDNTGQPSAGVARTFNAGPVSRYSKEGVYSAFRDVGFFIIRKDGRLFALSAICTHRKCPLQAERDRTFYCKCHGSTFDADGHVTKPPARRDLPVLASIENEKGDFIVTVPGW